MMRARLAALLILLSQAILLLLVFDMSGRNAIAFSLIGHPALALGLVLAAAALARRREHERDRRAAGPAGREAPKPGGGATLGRP